MDGTGIMESVSNNAQIIASGTFIQRNVFVNRVIFGNMVNV